MKKSLSILLTLIFLLPTFATSSFATSSNVISTSESTTINEWDEYSKIISMSDKELSSLGYTANEVFEIRNFDYAKEIRSRAALDDQTLKLYGYTDSEITKLREVANMKEITDAAIQSISTATMTSSLSYVSSGSRKENNTTMYYVNFKFSWKWNKIPFFRIVDMAIIGFNSTSANSFTYCVQSNNKVHADLIAINSASSNITQTESWVYSTEKANSIYAKFALGITDKNNNLTHFARSGYGTFQLTSRSNKNRLYIDACYAHTTVNIVPSYSVSTSGVSIGIKPKTGMDPQHCTGYFYEDYTIAKSYIYHGTVYGKNNTGGTAA